MVKAGFSVTFAEKHSALTTARSVIGQLWKCENIKLKRLHTISRKLDNKTALTKKRWKLQPVHLPAKMWKLHPGLKTKNKIRAIGHFSQKHSASCLLHFLLATLLPATWPITRLFQWKDIIQKYSTHLIRPWEAVYCDLKQHTHELQKSSLAILSHFQFSDFWWQGTLSWHQSRLCIVSSVFTRTHWVWQVAFRGRIWTFVRVILQDEIVFGRLWQVVLDYLFLYSWEWYNELGLTLTAWQALMDTVRTD